MMSCACRRFEGVKAQNQCGRRVLHTPQDRRYSSDCCVLGAICAMNCASRHCTPLLMRLISGSAGKNRILPSTTRFLPTKPQVAEVYNPGLVGRSRFFPALPESQNVSMRQIPKPLTTPPFSRKETAGRGVGMFNRGRQVWNLPHTSGNGLSLAINQREKIVSRAG